MWVEVLGILSTVFVLISFLFSDTVKIRVINIIGAVLFVVYGILLNAISVWLLNGALIGIHIFYLLKDKRGKK